jgi:hypothetical protein
VRPGAILRCRRVCSWIRKRGSEEEPKTSETKVALRLLVIIPVAHATRSLRLLAARTAGRGTNRGPSRDFGGAKTRPFRLPPKVSQRGGESRLRPFLFNNIPAFYSHLLCFHIYSRFAAELPAAVLCFQ